jgi:Cys-rich four helix bundle protein (predicted Tat secretion target)
MLRRDFIAGQTAFLTTASTACNNDDITPPKIDVKPAAPKPAKAKTPAAPAPDPHAGHGADHADHADHGDAAAVEAAGACIAAGQRCLQHCIALLAGGDVTMGECARATADMLALSGATAALAAAESPQLKALAAVALAAVTRCAEACDKHKATHPICKACGERCTAAAAEYRRIVG